LESGAVVVLVEEEVPPGAIAVLGKGLGYVPTPNCDAAGERLQMRQTVNRILTESKKRCSEESSYSGEEIPSQLRTVSYNLRAPAPDKQVNTLVERLVVTHDASLLKVKEKKSRKSNPQIKKSNLSSDEQHGLKWLKEMSDKSKISIVQADKGGAILIVKPDLLRKKVLEKLENEQLYTKLQKDPLNDLKKELFDIWKFGKIQEHVSDKIAYEIGGVSENNNMSTHPQFKPGVPYFYPMLKIHKVRKEELVPGVDPPARLVTSLRDGVAKRSDVYLADRYLKSLEKDYCDDLLEDTSSALRWLDLADRELTPDEKKQVNCFTFDFKSLYDSLQPTLVKEAVRYAMDKCRPDWTDDFKNWIISLIDFSLKASVAKYNGEWWKQNNGIPTGGSLCVQLANITVFYVMSKKVYSIPNMMERIRYIKRFIDDGAGLFFGTEEQFKAWLRRVNDSINPLGLHIDESSFQTNAQYINFLDIQYCFDVDGNLQTDLYTKETDSRSYLNFSSAHPNHTFSGNVYSQSLRLRRIINSNDRLKTRLDELADSFKKAGYPTKMVMEITNKVQNSQRNISKKLRKEEDDKEKIIVVSTYDADKNIVGAIKDSEDTFKLTQSFRNQHGPLFKYVKKVGPNLKTYVNTLKHQALGTKRGSVKRCGGRGCKTCGMLIKSPFVMIKNKKIHLAEGTCKSYNICYLARCRICNKFYTGRTVAPLHKRINGHRESYTAVVNSIAEDDQDELDTNSDLYVLGLHLHHDHELIHPGAFDQYMEFGILDVTNPTNIERKEYAWMHKLNTFQPVGINTEYPFGIPLLGQK
jgi:hypothetical protein